MSAPPNFLRRLATAVREECQGLLAHLVVYWPSTPLGARARAWYWRRQTGAEALLMARGARLTGCQFIRLGSHLAVGENVEFVADGTAGLSVWIGSHILFARGVYLRSSNHVIADRDRHILDQGHESKRVSFEGREYAIVIEDECWIGANAVIVSGAHIGRGAIIGAGAVVTGHVPAYAIAAGVPARVIGQRP